MNPIKTPKRATVWGFFYARVLGRTGDKLMFIALLNAVKKIMPLRGSAHTAVAIPIDFRQHTANLKGIATLVLQSAANLNRSIASGNRSLIQ